MEETEARNRETYVCPKIQITSHWNSPTARDGSPESETLSQRSREPGGTSRQPAPPTTGSHLPRPPALAARHLVPEHRPPVGGRGLVHLSASQNARPGRPFTSWLEHWPIGVATTFRHGVPRPFSKPMENKPLGVSRPESTAVDQWKMAADGGAA